MSEYIIDTANGGEINEELGRFVLEDEYMSVPVVPLVRCRDCAHSRIERHTGDDRRVCWKRQSHGEVVPDDGFCHDGKEIER